MKPQPLAGDGRATIAVETFDSLLMQFAEKVGAERDHARPARGLGLRI